MVFAIPLHHRFRGITVREGMLLRGEAGWGEWSPFLEYEPAVAEPWLRCAEEAAAGDWPSPCPRRRAGQRHGARGRPGAGAQDRARGRLRDGQGEGGRAGPVAGRRPGAGRGGARRPGPVGPGARRRERRLVGRRRGAARSALLDKAAGGLEYVEQPCATVEELAAVRRAVDVPIAADESIRRASDPYLVRDLEAADIAVLKVQPLGGVRACLRIAEEIGLPVVVSSALETSVGIAAGLALAGALPSLPYACGLATVQLLTADVVAEPLVPVDGMLPGPAADGRSARARPAGGHRRPGGALGGAAGRGAVTVSATELARARSSPRWSRTASARWCWRRVRGTRRSPSRRTTRPRRACSGCTPGSTSGPPASSPSG